jgi:sugar lactone lactonase YvrE
MVALAPDDAGVDAHDADETAQDAGAGAESDTGMLREPVDQTPPSGANGVAFDAEGMLWLADLFGRQVLRLDPASGEILGRFVQNSSGPDDVAIDARGRVFWTDWSSGQVGRLDPETKHEEILANLPPGVNSIAFTDDGRLFVGLVLLNRGLHELDPEGVRAPRLVSDTIGVNAFDFGPDGLVWGPSEVGIVKLDPEGGEIVETVVQGG